MVYSGIHWNRFVCFSSSQYFVDLVALLLVGYVFIGGVFNGYPV